MPAGTFVICRFLHAYCMLSLVLAGCCCACGLLNIVYACGGPCDLSLSACMLLCLPDSVVQLWFIRYSKCPREPLWFVTLRMLAAWSLLLAGCCCAGGLSDIVYAFLRPCNLSLSTCSLLCLLDIVKACGSPCSLLLQLSEHLRKWQILKDCVKDFKSNTLKEKITIITINNYHYVGEKVIAGRKITTRLHKVGTS